MCRNLVYLMDIYDTNLLHTIMLICAQYWEKFFANYKYEDEQKKDIALAIAGFC